MKRPQFSLRLMLLLVALAASLIAWQTVGWRMRHQGRMLEVQILEYAIRHSSDDDKAKGYVDWYRNRIESLKSEFP